MFRNRRFWLVTAVLLIAAGGITAYYITTYSDVTETSAESPEIQTSVARQGEITVSATGAGAVIAATEVELSFGISGVLNELLVHVGDDVSVGDELAILENSDAQHALAEADIQLLQTSMQTDASATETGVSYDDIAVEPTDNSETPHAVVTIDTAAAAKPYSRYIFGGFIEHFHQQVYGGLFDPGSPLSDEHGFRKDVIEMGLGALKATLARPAEALCRAPVGLHLRHYCLRIFWPCHVQFSRCRCRRVLAFARLLPG